MCLPVQSSRYTETGKGGCMLRRRWRRLNPLIRGGEEEERGSLGEPGGGGKKNTENQYTIDALA